MLRQKTNRIIRNYLFFFLIFCFHFTSVHAQKELSDSLITKRINFISHTLKQDRMKTKRWWYGWLSGYSAATVGQGMIYFTTSEKATRQDMALGAATTFLGVAGQFISQLVPGDEPEQINSMPQNTDAERWNKLSKAETLLAERAKRERLAMNWKNHALTGAVNLGGGIITWLGFKRSVWAGVGYFALNTVITETQIWTQPAVAKRNYKKYREKYSGGLEGISHLPRVNWYLKTYPGGFGIKVLF